MKPRFALVVAMVFGAAALRLLPHPANFDAIGALALFGGAHFTEKRWSFLIPFGALFLSDLILGFHAQMPLVYGVFALMVSMGFALRERRTALPVAGMAIAGSVLFFLVTNFGVWAFDGLYPMTLQGLVACYVAAIPFFQNTLLGNLFYAAVLFGGFALVEKKLPVIAPARG